MKNKILKLLGLKKCDFCGKYIFKGEFINISDDGEVVYPLYVCKECRIIMSENFKMKNKKQALFMMNISDYLEICELALKNGKKAGESMHEEFLEIMNKKKDKIKFLGVTEKDKDLLTGELREEGYKILNLDEIERRRKNNE